MRKNSGWVNVDLIPMASLWGQMNCVVLGCCEVVCGRGADADATIWWRVYAQKSGVRAWKIVASPRLTLT